MYDLSGRRILFVAYHYPPEGGAGLPGSMRTVKFVRNFCNANLIVLTKVCDKPFVDAEIALPVNGEKIYRSGSIDIFSLAMKMKAAIKRSVRFGNKSEQQEVTKSAVFATSVANAHASDTSNIFQRIKDAIHDLCYFPDQASPWVLPAFFKGLKVIKQEKIQIIFATGMPWSGLLVGWLLHFVTRKPLIIDFRDPWIGNPFHKRKEAFFDRISRSLERKMVRGAALVTLNTEPLRQDFIARYADVAASHFITLPNGYDLEDFKDVMQTRPFGETRELILCHAGFLYGLRDPATLLEAIRQCNAELMDQGYKIVFKQIGNIALGYDALERYSDLIQQKSFIVLPEKSYHDCLNELASADILVNIQPGTKTQIPSKLYDYLALNLPVLNLTPHDGALGKVVKEHGFGALFDETERAAIVIYLRDMLKAKTAGTLKADYPERVAFDVCKITHLLGNYLQKLID